jgi:hypothetical protein
MEHRAAGPVDRTSRAPRASVGELRDGGPIMFDPVSWLRNLDIQLDDAFQRTQRTSINLMWNPVPFVDVVVEYLAGTRVNKNGQRASSSQIQSGWTLTF